MVSGLSSGFDWRSMIDELLAIEHRRVDLVADQKSEYESKLAILQSTNTKLLTFKTQAETLSGSSAFNVFTSSLSTDSTTYSAANFLSVSTGTAATPGNHTITMNANSTVAQARTLSSKSFTSYDSALSLSGEFVINGRAAEVEAGDDLNDIIDKINNLNTGSDATGVTASLMTVSSDNYRLIMTSEDTGEDAFTVFDASTDAQDILSSGLGLTDGSVSIKNLISNGVRTEAFSSSSQSVASMLEISTAQSGTVTIGKDGDSDQFTVSVDLSQSLTQIASAINTAAGLASSNISASVVPTTTDGVETYRLEIQNATQFGNDSNDGDAKNVLQTLGFLEGGTSAVAEVHHGSVANTTSAANIISTTYWKDFDATIADGDTISFTATNNIGETVTGSYTIDTDTANDGDGETTQELLTAIEAAFTAQNASYEVTGSIADGQIRITDDVSGDSQLSLMIVANNEGNDSNLDFGTMAASAEGYGREVQSGQDANIILDGTTITSASNTIDDVIAGVTLNLLTVETPASGTKTVNITIARDYNTIKSSVQGLLNAYNDVVYAINEQFYYDEETQTAGLLQGDATLDSIRSSLQGIVVGTITGLPTTLNALSLIGITSQVDYGDPKNSGKLAIDEDDFKDAFNDNFQGLRRIFVAEGTTTDGDVEYIYHTDETVANEYDVNITQAATLASVTGTTDLVSSGLAADETLTITDTATGKEAQIALTSGTELTDIVNDINSELSQEYTELHISDTANTASASAVTYLTQWSEIDDTTVNADDTITVSGTKRYGSSVEDTYTISSTSDTLQGFLSFIEDLYDNEVSAYLDTNGKLVLQDNSVGDSSLSITITENNEGSGSDLDFGTLNTSNSGGVDGRDALDITASESGNFLKISHDNYGSSDGFTIATSGANLGLANAAYAGLDVTGTINSEAATGSGRILVGDAPGDDETTSVEGLTIKYTGSGTGAQGTVKITMGVAELFDRVLYDITNVSDGYLDYRLESIADRTDDLDDNILEMEARLNRKMEVMINRFVAMELALSKLQTQSDWLAGQISASFAGWA